MAQKLFTPRPIYFRCNQCNEILTDEQVSHIRFKRTGKGNLVTFVCPNRDCKGVSESEVIKS